MSAARAAHVIGLGAATSIGLTFPTTAAAVRGALNRFSVREHLRDLAAGEPITLALLSTLPADLPVAERMRHLAAGAAVQALAPWSAAVPRGTRLRVLLALPSPRPGFPPSMASRLARELLGSLPADVDALGCLVIPTAHPGGLVMIARALDEIRKGEVDAILVGGVDSYADIETLHWLERQERLKGENAPFGVLSGEGAGFLLIAAAELVERRRLRSFGEIVAVGQGQEPNPWYTRRPSLAEGLTSALFSVLTPAGEPPRAAAVTYADLNGEAWRAHEWSLAYVRTGSFQGHPLDLRHPASSWGDVGAASGPLLVGLACLDLEQGTNPNGSALVCTSSDVLPQRAACFVRRSSLGGEERP